VNQSGASDQPVSQNFLKLAGPGLIVAASGIGSGDVISATVSGANYGVTLLWAIALGAFLKFALNEGIARWQLATGLTALEGGPNTCPHGYGSTSDCIW
jgi:Mn2+/Fe2+ NRAMP family transporter